MDCPMVRRRVDVGELALHGWHYVIEDGEVHVLDVASGAFVPAYQAERPPLDAAQEHDCAPRSPCCT